MSTPFFTLAIPTKNRPDRLRNAVKSVVDQTFGDFEIVVCDNSDEGEAVQNSQRLLEFDDPRIRVIRTNGRLSMPDNWETAVTAARGEYIGVLTDRSVYRRDALQVVHGEIEKTGARSVSWFNDLYGRDPDGVILKRRACTMRRHTLDRDTVLDYFINGQPKYSAKIIPKLMTGVFHRSILQSARDSAVGRCCPPVCPDYTSGFLMLGHCDWILILDEALYTSCGYGTGSDFRMRGDLGDAFRRDLEMSWADMVDRMPSSACFSHALILNDFMRIQATIPERYPGIEVNRVQYYIGCMNDYVKTNRHGVERSEDLELLLAALEHESTDVQRQVRNTRVWSNAAGAIRDDPDLPPKQKKKVVEELPAFASVFDAMAWDEAQPRTPIESSFIDLLPRLDEMKTARAIDRKLNRL